MPFPFVYQTVFGGSNIYSSDVSYKAITLTTNIQLSWPLESTAGADNYAARIIDVTPTLSGAVIFLPDARGSGVGETILFTNVNSNFTFTVNAFGSTQVAQLDSGKSVQLYLADNSTAIGVWRVVPFGTNSSNAVTNTLAGFGLRANGNALDTAIPQLATDQNATLTPSNRAALVNWKGAGGVITLPDPGTLLTNWYCLVRNTGSATAYGQLTLQPASAAVLIDSAANKVLKPTESCVLTTDGVSYFTVGYGQNAQFAFDFVTVPLPSSGTYTLAGNFLNRIAYSFTGTLTGDITVLVPSARQQYWISNATAGAFNFYVGVTTSNRVQVLQGQRLIVYCDGANVVRANDNNVPIPIPISQGGTGSITANGALVNLGGGATGISIFNAATPTEAQNALGIVDQTNLTISLILALGG